MSYRIACIDLGGTMIKSGLWDGTALSHTQQTPTHAQEGAQAVLDRVITLVRAMGPIDGVGLSTAGEFGGMLVHPEDLQADDRGSGSYERYASTTALVRMARELDPTLTDGRAIFARLAEPAVSQLVDRWSA